MDQLEEITIRCATSTCGGDLSHAGSSSRLLVLSPKEDILHIEGLTSLDIFVHCDLVCGPECMQLECPTFDGFCMLAKFRWFDVAPTLLDLRLVSQCSEGLH